MSRIGRTPISVPADVNVTVDGDHVTVAGPKGTLALDLLPGITLTQDGDSLTIIRDLEVPETQQTFGLMRTLVNNFVVGVSKGYERQLEINGVGFRAAVAGSTITLNLGFSHPVVFELPEGIDARVERNVITISGYDKQLVGQVAANLRALKKPEPYKGKGIKYIEEQIKRKAGKTATKG